VLEPVSCRIHIVSLTRYRHDQCILHSTTLCCLLTIAPRHVSTSHPVHSKYLLPVLCTAIINSLDPSGPCGPDQLTDSHQRTWILMHRQLVRHPLAFEDMQCLNRQPIGYPMSRPSVFWPFWQELALCQFVVACHGSRKSDRTRLSISLTFGSHVIVPPGPDPAARTRPVRIAFDRPSCVTSRRQCPSLCHLVQIRPSRMPVYNPPCR
jgi:hypothetical protein